jgi:hypothetical protein
MPTRVYPPACLLEVFDDYLFPTLDLSRVAFFKGMPGLFDMGQNGFTLPQSGFSSQINVYVKESVYDPCDFESFLVVAHELVHVLQIQESFLGGRIPRWWTGWYVGCWLGWFFNGSDCDNRLEKEAYEYANGCPDQAFGGALRTCLTQAGLDQAPCDCSDPPWYHRSLVPRTTVTFYDELPRVCPDLVKKESTAGSWKCLLSPWAFLLAVIVGIIYGIGSIIVQIVSSIIDWVGGLFGDSKSWIWFTAFDGTDWFIPDVPVTKNDHTKTSAGPTAAVFNGLMYLAYKGAGDSDNLFYNVFDGQSWLDQDIRITHNDHTRTSAGPALAVFNGLLHLAYKGAGDSDNLFYNVFDGQSWLDPDIRITRYGSVHTARRPVLAEFGPLLYLIYRDNS